MSVGELLERKDRPAYVRFERVAMEDKIASKREGHYVARDVDYALITPPYSKDVFKTKVVGWLEDLDAQVQAERMPAKWAEQYKDAYRRWKSGQEIPLNGTPIKGWGVISPAQQETLIAINVLTVEDLAGINDEGVKRIGMGAGDLKIKARAWLAQLQDKGPLTMEISSVKAENAELNIKVDALQRQVEELLRQSRALGAQPREPDSAITASDLIEDVPPPPEQRRGPGRPPKSA